MQIPEKKNDKKIEKIQMKLLYIKIYIFYILCIHERKKSFRKSHFSNMSPLFVTKSRMNGCFLEKF